MKIPKVINYLVLVVLFCLLFFACEENKTVVQVCIDDTVYVPFRDTLYIKKVIMPDYPNVGERIKIVLTTVKEELQIDDVFLSSHPVPYDKIIGDTIFAYWPALSHKHYNLFKVEVYGGSKYNVVTYLLRRSLEREYNPINEISLIKNDELPVDTNNLYPMKTRYKPDWSFRKNQDSVFIEYKRKTSDDTHEIFTWIFLDQGKGNLPKLIEHSKYWNYWDDTSIFFKNTMEIGVVKIDKWNEDGIYSGITYAHLPGSSTTLFEKSYIGPRMLSRITFWVKDGDNFMK